ncbi:MAG: hypothetical protein JOZ31_13855 [Verrucomicrobia bacterium]|nr:hypothetical protein [Verrucomicrobiota bacterium]
MGLRPIGLASEAALHGLNNLQILGVLCVSVVNPFRARIWLACHSFSDGWLVLTVALAALAQVVASSCLMVLTWDGAGYVFNTIQRGHPVVPNSRYSDYPLLAVVSLFSFLINDSRLLACIYGLVLAVLPLGSLLLSFHFLSAPQHARLRIWPVLGILLSVLPGQAFLVAEAVPVAQVSWAVWAIAAADISISSLVWLAILNLFLFFLHPSSALVYAVTGALFVGKAWVETSHRRTNAWLGAIFLALAAVRLGYAVATANSYERGEESLSQNYLAFRDALPSLGMLPVVYLLGLTVLGGVIRRIPKPYMIWLAGLTLALLLAYGVAWAADPKMWVSAFTFRRFVFVGTLPLVVMGGLHWRYEQRSRTNDSSDRSDHRLDWIMAGSAAVFFIVFATQSFSWRQELSHFEADLKRCDKPVATIADFPWIADSPLHHWASTQLSCVVQGKKVKTVFSLDPDGVRRNKILLFPGIWFRRQNRWFEFEGVPQEPNDELRKEPHGESGRSGPSRRSGYP